MHTSSMIALGRLRSIQGLPPILPHIVKQPHGIDSSFLLRKMAFETPLQKTQNMDVFQASPVLCANAASCVMAIAHI